MAIALLHQEPRCAILPAKGVMGMDGNPRPIPVARIFCRGSVTDNEGWYVQHYVRSRLRTVRLELRDGADKGDVLTEAAGYLGCIRDQIQIEGAPWPAEQTLM